MPQGPIVCVRVCWEASTSRSKPFRGMSFVASGQAFCCLPGIPAETANKAKGDPKRFKTEGQVSHCNLSLMLKKLLTECETRLSQRKLDYLPLEIKEALLRAPRLNAASHWLLKVLWPKSRVECWGNLVKTQNV